MSVKVLVVIFTIFWIKQTGYSMFTGQVVLPLYRIRLALIHQTPNSRQTQVSTANVRDHFAATEPDFTHAPCLLDGNCFDKFAY